MLILLENWLVFRPSRASDSWVDPPDPRIEEVTAALPDGTPVHAWWLPPAAPEAGAILFCHGNAGNLSHRGGIMLDAHRALDGLGVLVFDYPGYGKSGGSPSERGCLAAADVYWTWLTLTAQIPPRRIVLMGKSLGGGVATDLAVRVHPRALVLVKTFTSLPAVAKGMFPILPIYTFMRTQFDNQSKLAGLKTPVFIAHGTADTLVPPEHADSLYAAAHEPKMLFKMPGDDHNAPLGESFYTELKSFLEKQAP
jgi:fermentation-respiration switch protein FrsA (DUF1100 family)